MKSRIETDYFVMNKSDFQCKNGWKCDECPADWECGQAMLISEEWKRATAAGAEDDL